MTSIVKTPTGFNIERPCKYCGTLTMELSEAKPPHGQGLRCTGCKRHNGWVSKADQAILDDANKDGFIDMEKLTTGRDQAQRLADEAAREGEFGKQMSMIKLRDNYIKRIKEAGNK